MMSWYVAPFTDYQYSRYQRKTSFGFKFRISEKLDCIVFGMLRMQDSYLSTSNRSVSSWDSSCNTEFFRLMNCIYQLQSYKTAMFFHNLFIVPMLYTLLLLFKLLGSAGFITFFVPFKVNSKAAESLADPAEYPNLFEDWQIALNVEATVAPKRYF